MVYKWKNEGFLSLFVIHKKDLLMIIFLSL